jgi:uncharacterized repeat protein (TIGR01451 family)
MSQSDRYSDLSRVLRGSVAVCGAVLVLGLLCTLLGAGPRVAVGEPEGPTAATGLQIDKLGPDSAFAGDVITYTLLVTNSTASVLDGVIITDTWNSQLYSGTYEAGGAVVIDSMVFVTQPSKYVQFNLAPLPANSNGYLQITMTIAGGILRPIVLGNSVVITTSTPGVTANTDSVNTSIIGPVLLIAKTVTPTAARPGQLLTYTLRVDNRYRSDAIDATNVVITEKLPSNLIFEAALPPGLATFFPATNTVEWDWPGTVPISTSVFVTFTARITPTAPNGNLSNPAANCRVKADGVPLGIPCSAAVNVAVDDVFEKAGRTVSPPAQTGTISRTFPNRSMTYTVSVYSPFTTTVTGMVVTDTLPTNSNVPTQTFYYSGLLAAGPQGLPTVVSLTSRIVAWQLPTLQPGSVYTFSFQAFVPPQMFINDNALETPYTNKLAGSYSNIVLSSNTGHDDSMDVKVVRQIELIKTVTPSSQNWGEAVTYTFVVSNAGPTTVRDIQLTDLLPASTDCAFQWESLVSGQSPIFASGGRVSWGGITLTGYSQTTLAVFRATVYGNYLKIPPPQCTNTVQGYSPDSYIVKRTGLAPVTVLPPLGGGGGHANFAYTKTVNSTSVVLGEQIQYIVQEYNVTNTAAHMTRFYDYLPTGFYYNGQSVYSETVDFWLQPNSGNRYQANIPVDVMSTTEACDKLPEPVYQYTGSLQLLIDSPLALAGTWVNPVRVAPVMVYPQANVSKTFSPGGALPGGVFTFTIMVTNNKSSPLAGLRVTDTLPNGFVFGTELPGTPPKFAWVPPNLLWDNLTIPAHGKLSLVFTATASSTAGDYQNTVSVGSPTDPWVCVPKYKTPTFLVRRGIVEVTKQVAVPSNHRVNPLGQFQYNIGLKNVGPFTVTVSRFTETLPGVSGYPWKYVSMQSGDPLPVSTTPLAWADLVIGPNQTRSLRVNVRASYQVGDYPNMPPQCSPASLAGYMTGTVPSGWVLTNTTASACNTGIAPVTIIPGVGVSKDVYPEAITLPQQSTVIYTITVVNVSGNTVNNLRITDTLPTGFVWDAYIGGDLPQTTNPPVWTIGSMPDRTTKLLSFRAKVAALQPSGTYYNRLNVSGDSLSVPPTGNIAPVKVKGLPTLNLSKSVTPAIVPTGRSVTYTLALDNPDPSDPVTARVTDTLPGGFTFAEMISGPAPLATGSQVVWDLTVPSDTIQLISFRAAVDASAPNGTYYNQLDGSSPQIVFQGTGPTAPVGVVQPTYDLQVAKSDAAYTATIGSETVYTLRYTNTQNSLDLTAGSVVLTEAFAPVDYLLADAPDWNLVSPGVYTYFVGDLPAGATGEVTFGLQIDNGIPADYFTITNTVEIDDAGAIEIPEAIEQPITNNLSTDVDVIRGADLAVTDVRYAPASPAPGRPITVFVTLENRGIDPAVGPEAAGWFDSNLYIKPVDAPPPSDPGDLYLGLCPTPGNYCPLTARKSFSTTYSGTGLLPGQTATLTFTTILQAGGAQWLYVQADTFWGDPATTVYGTPDHARVWEIDETNNIFGPISFTAGTKVYLPLIRK